MKILKHERAKCILQASGLHGLSKYLGAGGSVEWSHKLAIKGALERNQAVDEIIEGSRVENKEQAESQVELDISTLLGLSRCVCVRNGVEG